MALCRMNCGIDNQSWWHSLWLALSSFDKHQFETTMLHRVLTLILSLATLACIQAQEEYIPLVVEGTHWKICHDIQPDYPWPCGRMFEYYLSGDTLIEGQAYKNLYIRLFVRNDELPGGGWSSHEWPLQVSYQYLAGFIREDIQERKVYWLDSSENLDTCNEEGEEILLYDFSLEVGDSTYTCGYEDEPLVVQEIRTEELYGRERRVFYFEDAMFQIEGIGFTTGLLVPPIEILNFHLDYIVDYCVGNDMDCGVITEDMMISPYREWHVLGSSFDFSNGNSSITTSEHRFRDTIQHDGHLYLRLQTRLQDENGPLDWQFSGFSYRQDGPRVYRYPQYAWQAGEELLVYDYSMSVGDTFFLPNLLVQPMILNEIDTITLLNGEARRRFIFTPEEWQGFRDWYWIEGIGANDHPFFPENSFEEDVDGPEVKTQCFYLEPDLENPVWRQFQSSNCLTYIVDADEAQELLELEVYPNPTQELLHLKPVPRGAYAQLFAATGQQLLQSAVSGGESILALDLRQLPSGIYNWVLFDADHQRLSSGRIVKQ